MLGGCGRVRTLRQWTSSPIHPSNAFKRLYRTQIFKSCEFKLTQKDKLANIHCVTADSETYDM